MDDTKIRCFLSLCRTLNFTQTAHEVFLTQQAVSNSISSLEKELELRLFDRSTRSVQLTPEGSRLYSVLCRMEGEFQDILSQLRRQQRPLSLKVGYQNFLTFHDELRNALSALCAEFPEVSLQGDRFCPPLLRHLLARGELDMIVVYQRFSPTGEGLCSLPLYQVPQYLMVSRELPIPDGAPAPKLLSHPFLIDRFEHESRQDFSQRIQMERRLWGFTGETVIVPDRDSAYTYAELGRGVVIGTDFSVMSSGRALNRYYSGVDETLCAVWQSHNPSPVIPRYAQLLQQAFATLRP